MDASVSAQLRAGDVVFSDTDADLLRAIADTGSVSGASEALGRSRSRALERIQVLEDAFGPLVTRSRGGADGGGSDLTANAERLVARYTRLQTTLAGTANVAERVLLGTVIETNGELATVRTQAGLVRARLARHPIRGYPGIESRVQVSIRSDAVTLHSPSDTPPADGTSARNQFDGQVGEIDRGTTIATVSVNIDGADSLAALVTHESLDRLALTEGDSVVATFKATATRALSIE